MCSSPVFLFIQNNRAQIFNLFLSFSSTCAFSSSFTSVGFPSYSLVAFRHCLWLSAVIFPLLSSFLHFLIFFLSAPIGSLLTLLNVRAQTSPCRAAPCHREQKQLVSLPFPCFLAASVCLCVYVCLTVSFCLSDCLPVHQHFLHYYSALYSCNIYLRLSFCTGRNVATKYDLQLPGFWWNCSIWRDLEWNKSTFEKRKVFCCSYSINMLIFPPQINEPKNVYEYYNTLQIVYQGNWNTFFLFCTNVPLTIWCFFGCCTLIILESPVHCQGPVLFPVRHHSYEFLPVKRLDLSQRTFHQLSVCARLRLLHLLFILSFSLAVGVTASVYTSVQSITKSVGLGLLSHFYRMFSISQTQMWMKTSCILRKMSALETGLVSSHQACNLMY